MDGWVIQNGMSLRRLVFVFSVKPKVKDELF